MYVHVCICLYACILLNYTGVCECIYMCACMLVYVCMYTCIQHTILFLIHSWVQFYIRFCSAYIRGFNSFKSRYHKDRYTELIHIHTCINLITHAHTQTYFHELCVCVSSRPCIRVQTHAYKNPLTNNKASLKTLDGIHRCMSTYPHTCTHIYYMSFPYVEIPAIHITKNRTNPTEKTCHGQHIVQ
jgi:hypothetical protein